MLVAVTRLIPNGDLDEHRLIRSTCAHILFRDPYRSPEWRWYMFSASGPREHIPACYTEQDAIQAQADWVRENNRQYVQYSRLENMFDLWAQQEQEYRNPVVDTQPSDTLNYVIAHTRAEDNYLDPRRLPSPQDLVVDYSMRTVTTANGRVYSLDELTRSPDSLSNLAYALLNPTAYLIREEDLCFEITPEEEPEPELEQDDLDFYFLEEG